MMIPLFVMMRKNFVVTKLGWAVVSVTCFSPYAKISTKNKREKVSIFKFEMEMLPWFHTNKKGSRLLGFVVLKFRRQTFKTILQGSINNFMCAHASNQGGRGGFFTSLLSEWEFLAWG